MKTKQKLNLYDLQLYVLDMHIVPFESRAFQRKFRKFFKFSFVYDNLFYMRSKITFNSMTLSYVDNRFKVINSAFKSVNFEFTASSSKELINKLIKHDLI